MKINVDGTIDSSTRGFYSSEYTQTGHNVDAEKHKQNTIAEINIKIKNVSDMLDEVNATILRIDGNPEEGTVGDLAKAKDNADKNQGVINDINALLNNGYTYITINKAEELLIDSVKEKVNNTSSYANSFNISNMH